MSASECGAMLCFPAAAGWSQEVRRKARFSLRQRRRGLSERVGVRSHALLSRRSWLVSGGTAQGAVFPETSDFATTTTVWRLFRRAREQELSALGAKCAGSGAKAGGSSRDESGWGRASPGSDWEMRFDRGGGRCEQWEAGLCQSDPAIHLSVALGARSFPNNYHRACLSVLCGFSVFQ